MRPHACLCRQQGDSDSESDTVEYDSDCDTIIAALAPDDISRFAVCVQPAAVTEVYDDSDSGIASNGHA